MAFPFIFVLRSLLYDKAYVIRDREAIGEWPIIARSRRITY